MTIFAHLSERIHKTCPAHSRFGLAIGIRCMPFADAIVLVDEDGPEVWSILEKWKPKLENVVVKFSITKTEYMLSDFGGLSISGAIARSSAFLPVCSDFLYVYSLVSIKSIGTDHY